MSVEILEYRTETKYYVQTFKISFLMILLCSMYVDYIGHNETFLIRIIASYLFARAIYFCVI